MAGELHKRIDLRMKERLSGIRSSSGEANDLREDTVRTSGCPKNNTTQEIPVED